VIGQSIQNIFKIPDLRRRIFFTFALLAVYRVGAHIPTPGVNPEALAEFWTRTSGTLLSFFDMFAGGALGRSTIFALGIMPYITASIIFQLLTVIWPYLERLKNEGELGRKKINQYTRYATVLICSVQSFGISMWLQSISSPSGVPIVNNPGWGFKLMTVITMTAGTVFIMWLGEQITERGIGNGISLIIFAGIVVGFPRGVLNTFRDLQGGNISILRIIFLSAFMIIVVGFIVAVERAQRKIPVSYAKRVIGRRMYGGQSTHLPLRVNMSGVIPVIFASSIIAVPQTLAQMMPYDIVQSVAGYLGWGMPFYYLLYLVGIIFFCYFYTAIIFNPVEVAENFRKYGGYIPGIRPGKRTSDHIDYILTRITFAGAIYLAAVSMMPDFLYTGIKLQAIPFLGGPIDNFLHQNNLDWITQGMGINFRFGGTSLLIVVGVAMDTVQQIESQLIMRHYDGFLKQGRIKGRRY